MMRIFSAQDIRELFRCLGAALIQRFADQSGEAGCKKNSLIMNLLRRAAVGGMFGVREKGTGTDVGRELPFVIGYGIIFPLLLRMR